MVIIASYDGRKRAFTVSANEVKQEIARLEKEGYIILAIRPL